jgi:hypothetical protein
MKFSSYLIVILIISGFLSTSTGNGTRGNAIKSITHRSCSLLVNKNSHRLASLMNKIKNRKSTATTDNNLINSTKTCDTIKAPHNTIKSDIKLIFYGLAMIICISTLRMTVVENKARNEASVEVSVRHPGGS